MHQHRPTDPHVKGQPCASCDPAADAGPRQPEHFDTLCRYCGLTVLAHGGDHAGHVYTPRGYAPAPPVPQEAVPTWKQTDAQGNADVNGAYVTATAPDWAMRLSIDICRELYDRFMMGGWEPQDAHEQCADMIRQDSREREE